LDRAVKAKLGQIVREFRKQRGLTQRELGQSVGVTLSQISNIETGHTPPSLETLVRIARTLRVPLPEMFGFDRAADTGRAEQRAKIMALISAMAPDELDLAHDLIKAAARTSRRSATIK
jgi:transcriptional regulator with XRE-family HTH domain